MIIDEQESYIDLNLLTSNVEIPISAIMKTKVNLSKDINFKYEETIVNDANASIKYYQYNCKLMIEVFGPKECKYRDKLKTDSSIVETYIKFNNEYNRESKKY
jgi:hypothetical protein